MDTSILLQDIRYLKGIGPKRAKEFSLLGIRTLKDLLYFFPRKYEDRRYLSKISDLKPGHTAIVKGKVILTSLRRTRRGMNIFESVIDDGTGLLLATWFNQPYLKNVIKKNQELLLYGRIDYYKGLRIISPDYETLEEGKFNLGILPVYSLRGKLSQKFMRKIFRNVVEEYAHKLGEFIPYNIRTRLGLLNRVKSLHNIHFPENEDLLLKAQERFSFEEIFLLQLAVGIRRLKRKFFAPGISHKFDSNLRKRFQEVLSFELTQDQKKVLDQIEKDMTSPRPMNRLLQGEVGTGKTIIGCYAALIAASGGYQTAIMVPTEILAQQQYVKIGELLSKFNLEVGILISGQDRKYQEEVKEGLRSGQISVVVGTHSLIQEDIDFLNLGLVVIDEQHKFGVQQREDLKKKGKAIDCLIMTATPIPRSLALTLFGDMDISTMKEFPYGEKNTNTYWITEEKRKDVYIFLKERVKKGMQGFVVCPRIEDEIPGEIRTVGEVYNELKQLLGEKEVGLLHGKMSWEEKKKIMNKFQNGNIKILVSTIIIEVGMDVPDASIMIIEEADRFGLSQLHQLRGRIGRAGQEAYCILIAEPRTQEAVKRLEAMVHWEDGFKISQEDLEIRGAGEFFGLKQHGFFDIRFRNISTQIDLLNKAREEAFNLLKTDPHLNLPQGKALKEELLSRFPQISATI